jgi:inosine triphosphate pyrophosphatase
MQKITFITGNSNKLREAREILPDFEIVNQKIDLPEIQEMAAQSIIEAKLKEAYALHQGSYIVEDTSLCFNALNGLPGPLIKWFLQKLGTKGTAELVAKYTDHTAVASCMIGYITEAGDMHFFAGRVDGKIVLPRGDTDFGWDPIFQPVGSDLTFAQMSPQQKNAVSHRRQALLKLAAFLQS